MKETMSALLGVDRRAIAATGVVLALLMIESQPPAAQ
jgi:hypothetical protein